MIVVCSSTSPVDGDRGKALRLERPIRCSAIAEGTRKLLDTRVGSNNGIETAGLELVLVASQH